MIASIRAALAVLMLAGFYLLTLVQTVAVIAFGGWLSTLLPGALAVKVLWPLLVAVAGTVGVASWRAIRTRPTPPEGLPVTLAEAPHLWEDVRRLAAEVGTRAPDEIRTVLEVNAAVVEQTRLLGLLPGRRYLYLGMPLIQGVNVAQLHAIVAHELGHYSGQHTRLGAVAYRGRIAIGGTIDHIGRRNPIGWSLRAYARLYLLVDHAVLRRQELQADRAAVWLVGRATAASALREVHAIAAAWSFYLDRYVKPGWQSGYAPADMFGGFRDLLGARQGDMERLRQTDPDAGRGRWDTHPPLAERLAAIGAAPVRAVAIDDRPAVILLPGIDLFCQRLQAAMVDTGGRTVLPWSELTARAAVESVEQAAAELVTALRRFVGGAAPVTLGTLLDLVEAGRMAELAQPLLPAVTQRELPERFARHVASVMALGALRSGAAQCRHSWSGAAELVGTGDGIPLELTEIARLAVAPDTVARARRRLTAAGVDLSVRFDPTTPEVRSPERALAGLANIKLNDVAYDLLVFDAGLVLIADPGPQGSGRARLTALVEDMSFDELADRNWLIRYDAITRARITKNTPVHAELDLEDGRHISIAEPWTAQALTKQSPDVLVRLLTTKPRTRPVPVQETPAGNPERGVGPGTDTHTGHVDRPTPAPARTGTDDALAGAAVLDGLANVKVDKVPNDLLVLDIGLVLIADPGPFEKGRERLTGLIQSRSAAEIAAQHWFIPYDQIMSARIVKDIPLRAELELADGRRLTINEPWTTQNLTDRSGQVLREVLLSVGAPA